LNEGFSCDDPNSYQDPSELCTAANPHAYFDAFNVETLLAKPTSSPGTVRISGRDFHSEPLIDPKLLIDEADVESMVDGEC